MARKKNKPKRKSSKGKSRKPRLPSWREVRAGLLQQSKIKLLLVLGKIYLSPSTPRFVKLKIVKMASGGKLKVRKLKSKVKSRKSSGSKKKRSAKQKAATRKLIAFNRNR